MPCDTVIPYISCVSVLIVLCINLLFKVFLSSTTSSFLFICDLQLFGVSSHVRVWPKHESLHFFNYFKKSLFVLLYFPELGKDLDGLAKHHNNSKKKNADRIFRDWIIWDTKIIHSYQHGRWWSVFCKHSRTLKWGLPYLLGIYGSQFENQCSRTTNLQNLLDSG